MNIIDFIAARRAKPHARGEGIRAVKTWRNTQAGLLVDVVFQEQENALSEALLEQIRADPEMAARLAETW